MAEGIQLRSHIANLAERRPIGHASMLLDALPHLTKTQAVNAGTLGRE
jgi:hypothetical protein